MNMFQSLGFPIFIKFDRAICKGRIATAFVITLGILLVPIIAGFLNSCSSVDSHSCSQKACVADSTKRGTVTSQQEDTLSTDDTTSSFIDAFESYLNPNFNKTDSYKTRSYRLIVGYLGAFLLNGLLVSLVVSWFQKRRDRWEKGQIHYSHRLLGNYTIVIGGNEMVPDLVKQLLTKNDLDYVLVMTNRDVPVLRNKFVSMLGKMENKVVIYYGERTSMDDLKNLMVSRSKDIYIIGEQLDISQSGSHHDVKNMDCVQKIADQLGNNVEYRNVLKKYSDLDEKTKNKVKDPKLVCRVMFEYQSTFSVFQFADVDKKISEVLYFKPFNYYETWAQKVLVCKEIDLKEKTPYYLPLEGGKAINAESEDTVHLIVVGMSRMGIAFAVEAAHLAHYPNFITNEKVSRITFIDPQAWKEMNYVQGHYKELFAVSRWRYMEAKANAFYYDEDIKIEETEWQDPRKDKEQSPYKATGDYTLGDHLVDIEWQFIQGDLEMPSIQDYIKEETQKENVRLTIAICLPQDNVSLAASLYLPDEVYETGSNVQQVLVYQPFGDAMLRSFDATDDMSKSYKLFTKLRAFGMMDGCFSIEEQDTMKNVCAAFHQQYSEAAKEQIPGRNKLRKRLDLPVVSGGKSPAAKRWSSYYSASHLWTKLRSIEFEQGQDIGVPTQAVLAEVEHVRWNMEQLLMGYAPLKAAEYVQLMNLRKEAMKTQKPQEDLKRLNDDKNEEVNCSDYQLVIEWLNAWYGYDELREKQKADMSHADLCSLEILKKIDEEAMDYDKVLVGILPQIYAQIQKGNTEK